MSKQSGGHIGNKGVVSKITPRDKMPVAKNGKRAKIILNALGVCNRLNPAQLYELELNFLADNIAEDMKKMSLNDAKKFYFGYLKDINKEQYKSVKAFYNSLDKKEKVAYLKEVMNDGFSTYQPPFWDNIGFDRLKEIYKKYKYEPYEVTIEGLPVENRLIISDVYMIRLKHEPKSKLSARSTSYINMKNAPSKSLSYKKHEEPYSKTPIRIGNLAYLKIS